MQGVLICGRFRTTAGDGQSLDFGLQSPHRLLEASSHEQEEHAKHDRQRRDKTYLSGPWHQKGCHSWAKMATEQAILFHDYDKGPGVYDHSNIEPNKQRL
jgi:hypothetical protein